MEAIVSFFFCAIKLYQLKARHPEIKPCILYLGNISKDFTIDNGKKQG